MFVFPFYAVGFLVAILALVFWFYFRTSNKFSKIFQLTLFAGLGLYLVSLLSAGLPLDMKLNVLVRDLLIIGSTGLVFQFLARKRPAFFLGLMALIIVMVWFYKNRLQPTMAYSAPPVEAIELDRQGELLVEIKDDLNITALDQLLTRYGLEYEPAFQLDHADRTDLDDYYVIDVPDNRLDQLQAIQEAFRASGAIDWLEPNEVIKLDDPATSAKLPGEIRKKYGIDDPGLEYLWSFDQMDMDLLYQYLQKNKVKPARKALIAILDTGVDGKHEDLSGNYKSIKSKYDNDPRGHGTHCAGIAAAVSNNGLGVASFSRNNEFVEVASIKVLSAFGSGTQRSIINGMLEAADKGADVISMSLGGRSSQSRQRAYEKAVKYANEAGAIVVAAAGNSNRNAKDFSPVNAKGVIGVSAVDENLNRAIFSNYVTDLKMGIAAPGVDIYSTTPGDKYATYSGTSMATPYVAGLVGLLKSLNPKLTTAEAHSILYRSGKKTKVTKETGRFIQPAEAVRALLKR